VKKIISAFVLTIFSVALSGFSVATVAQQKLIPAESSIAFISKQLGVPVSGKFKKFDADVAFDPKKPDAAKVSFSVDLLSADIGNSETETELKKPGWFNSAKEPAATFESSGVKTLGGGKFEFTGKLAMKGASQNVVVPVMITQTAAKSRVVGSFKLKRLDFKIGDGDWNDLSLVANEVVVNINLSLTGIPPL
jgi:polyisoprenoid-binding protein YceI